MNESNKKLLDYVISGLNETIESMQKFYKYYEENHYKSTVILLSIMRGRFEVLLNTLKGIDIYKYYQFICDHNNLIFDYALWSFPTKLSVYLDTHESEIEQYFNEED